MITIPIDNGVMVISVWGVLAIGAAIALVALVIVLLIVVVMASRRRGGRHLPQEGRLPPATPKSADG